MTSGTVKVSIAKRTRQAVILALVIFIGMIFSISTAEAKNNDHRFGKKSVASTKRHNKRYSNACKLLEAKWNKRQAKQEKKVKWR